MYEGNHTCKRAALWNRIDLELQDLLPNFSPFETADVANAVVPMIQIYASPEDIQRLNAVDIKQKIEAVCYNSIGKCKSADSLDAAKAFSLIWAVFSEYRVGAKDV